jgi:hypothetical protein
VYDEDDDSKVMESAFNVPDILVEPLTDKLCILSGSPLIPT